MLCKGGNYNVIYNQAIYQEIDESSSYVWTSVEKYYSRKMQVQKLRTRINEKIELSHVESNFGGISCVHPSLEK